MSNKAASSTHAAGLTIERLPLSSLSPDPANARTHPERNLATIVASLRRFGQQKPIVIDSGGVIRAGNGTYGAAKQLGWETIDCVRTSLQGSEATAYAIADNRTAELAEWDDAALAATLEGLQFDDEDLLTAAVFSEDDLANLLKASALNDDSERESSTKEIDENEFDLEHKCPKCGFEFNDET